MVRTQFKKADNRLSAIDLVPFKDPCSTLPLSCLNTKYGRPFTPPKQILNGSQSNLSVFSPLLAHHRYRPPSHCTPIWSPLHLDLLGTGNVVEMCDLEQFLVCRVSLREGTDTRVATVPVYARISEVKKIQAAQVEVAMAIMICDI